MQQLSTIHYPNLKTVLMVEDALKAADLPVRREQLKRTLPKAVMHQTLNVILEYLEESGKILDTRKGIVWTHNPNQALAQAIRSGTELSSFSQHKPRRISNARPTRSRKR